VLFVELKKKPLLYVPLLFSLNVNIQCLVSYHI
jgi:hypothetical protein